MMASIVVEEAVSVNRKRHLFKAQASLNPIRHDEEAFTGGVYALTLL
jgi:hypothetical protein